MNIVVMSGIPGSGKSTYVKSHISNAQVLSTDNHHIDSDGVYRFKADKIGEFHDKTFKMFVGLCVGLVPMTEGKSVLVVDNTNITQAEFMPYLRVAEAFGHHVEMVRIYCHPITAIARGTHGVPPEIVRRMAQSMEPIPPRYSVIHMM
jgi:predicted kinase